MPACTYTGAPLRESSTPLHTVGWWLVRHRIAVLVVALASAVALAFAVPQLQVGFRVDGFFRSDDPELQQAMAHYGDGGFEYPDRLLLFGWDEAEPTGAASIQRLARFAAALGKDPVVERVLTLADAKVPGALRSDPERVAASATWRHLLVARGGDAVAGMVVLQPNQRGEDLVPLFVRLRALAAAEGKTLHLCGLPFHTATSQQLVRDDMARFLPIGTAVSAVLLFWLIPHWVLALLALVVVPLTLVSTLGVMALVGVEMTMLTSTLPTLLLCMSVADGVHMVGRFLEERRLDGEPKAAAARTFAAMFVPCLMTSLTTIVGFGTLCTARLVDLRWLGVFAALGMVFAWLYTMAILPAALSFVRWPAGRRPMDPSDLVVRGALCGLRISPRGWAFGSALVLVVAAFGASRVEVEHKLTSDLWPDSEVVQQMRWYEERFVGIVPSEVIVTTKAGFGDAERDQLAQLRQRLEALPGVSRTLSIADLLADGLPPLLLPALARSGLLPTGMLSDDGRTARVMVFRGDFGTTAFRAFAGSIAALATEHPAFTVRLAGMNLVGTEQVLRMTDDLVWSFVGSFGLIFLLVWLQCRSLGLALLGMLSCLLPMLVLLSLMAWLEIALRPLTVIAFCVALGLMIDDAIHLLARWQEERRQGRLAGDAAHTVVVTAGKPVVVTTLLLLVGFATILGSGFRGTATFGFLVVVALLGALFAALGPLPALLRGLAASKDGGRRTLHTADPQS